MAGETSAGHILHSARENAAKLLAELHREEAELRAAAALQNKFDLPKGMAAVARVIEAAKNVSHCLEHAKEVG